MPLFIPSHVLAVALGAALRFLTGASFLRLWPQAHFPWATLSVNLLGALIIGYLTAYLGGRETSVDWGRYFLITGILGGFTTFSAFSLETATMLQRGEMLAALSYAAASVIGTIMLVFLGFYLGKS
ncbi:MAG: fluoride efflux transporter CrcB [Dongiaceae bacterium]